jgi:hypothetical protein
MLCGKKQDGLDYTVIAVMNDGSYVPIPTQMVISYKDRDRSEAWGVGVSVEELVRELQEVGEIHIARQMDHRGPYDVFKARDIVEVYTVKLNEEEPIVPPKTGLRWVLWRLSML